MLIGLPVAIAVLVQAAAAPPEPAANPATEASAALGDSCRPPSATSTTIVICAQRPQGYRINPDVMEARREMRSGGRPVRPYPVPRPDCATVGPAPCVAAGINVLAAAGTVAEIAERLSKGEEVGSMFVTDPHPDEYHLYLMAKARREQEEAEKAALAKAKAATAAQPAQAGQPSRE